MNASALTAALTRVAVVPPAWRDDLTVPILLVLAGLLLGVGVTLFTLSLRGFRRRRVATHSFCPAPVPRIRGREVRWLAPAPPSRWLAIKVSNPRLVLAALRLHNPVFCSWEDGLTLAHEHKLFISPGLGGWVLVMGTHLPDPAEDVDRCFLFLLNLSRKLGEVHFFSANRILHHHAWVRVDRGRVVRAYAWAGTTLWNQGRLTPAEAELGVFCFDYGTTVGRAGLGLPNPIVRNTQRVPLLAARWSVDPGTLDLRALKETQGIAGELTKSRTH